MEWRGWIIIWEPELQSYFRCHSQLWGWWISSVLWCADGKSQLSTVSEIFLSREAGLWVLAGQSSVSLCLVRMNSVCQSSALVTDFQYHADDAGPGCFEWDIFYIRYCHFSSPCKPVWLFLTSTFFIREENYRSPTASLPAQIVLFETASLVRSAFAFLRFPWTFVKLKVLSGCYSSDEALSTNVLYLSCLE